MRLMFSMLVVLVLAVQQAGADTTVVIRNYTTAQQDAETMARTGVLAHCGKSGGRREGVGFSTVSAEAAVRSCCFFQDAQRGRYRIVERGVARGAKGWFAVIRLE